MNVLEKILEEIEERKKAYHMYSKEVDMIAMLDIRQRMRELNCVEKIIRSHMDEVKNDDWIPVEERLPEEDGFYLATLDGEICGKEEAFTGLAEFEHGKWIDDEEGYKCVLAWQPLPEPYIKNPK